MRHPFALPIALLLSACAPASFVAPTVAGQPGGEVSKLVASSEANQFPCRIKGVKGARGAQSVDLGGAYVGDVTLPPGSYRVMLHCTSGFHKFEPQADVAARSGRSYRVTGYLLDDSITIFTMKMGAKVTELP